MDLQIIPGAEPWSHEAGPVGVLCLHGFTGNPASMRPVARALADAGHSIELPRLPGHGTSIDDMLTTGFSDWAGEAEAALGRLRARTDQVVVAGLSMGGLLTLWLGVHHPDLAGLIAINPVTIPPDDEALAMAKGMIEDGMPIIPGIGSDIADPDVTENSYPGTPIVPLLSLMEEGVRPISTRFGELKMPLLLMNSPQDHVIDPANADHVAATAGSEVERVVLERSYHVATLDYDRDLICDRAREFVARVTAV